jgi:glutaredoxin-like protein
MIPERECAQIRDIFDRDLVSDVRLEVFYKKPSMLFIPGRQESQSGPQLESLIRELAALTDKLQVESHDIQVEPESATAAGVERVPTVLVHGANAGAVRFLGAPSGYEFSTLIADIVDVSRGDTDLSEETRAALKDVNEPVHIQVFSTPDCPYCPRAARLAHLLAMENEHITADAIDATEFPDLARQYQVMSVPKIVINDRVEFTGAQPEAVFIDAIQRALPAKEDQEQ